MERTYIHIPKHPTLLRYSGGKESTLGLMFVGGVFQHYVLEDEFRAEKVYGETRIAEGIYELDLREEGGFHELYLQKFGADFHKGMVHILNVPKFKYVLYHIGNDDDDTDACQLPGDTANNNQIEDGFIGNSTQAYERTYPKLADYILQQKAKGEKAYFEIIDLENIAGDEGC